MKKIATLLLVISLSLAAGYGGLSKQSPNSTRPSPVTGNSSAAKPTSSSQTPNNSKSGGAKPINSPKPQTQSGGSVISTSNKAAAEAYIAEHGLTLVQNVAVDKNLVLLSVAEKPSDPKVQAITAAVPDTKASADYIYHAAFAPNDPAYPDQWALPKISASSAWDISTGSSSTTIAVIDTGILFSQTFGTPPATYSQVDFPTSRMWTNPGETGLTTPGSLCWTGVPADKSTNNCDDDGNGKIDDWRGWDFMGGYAGGINCPNGTSGNYIAGDNDPQPYSCDTSVNRAQLNKTHYSGGCAYDQGACYVGHGTMVASVAAASTNNGQLIAGLNHNTKLMALRVIDGYGYTDTPLVTAAVRYATSKSVNVINMSLTATNCSSGVLDPVLESALADAKAAGITVVAAAGNEGFSSSGSVCYPGSSSNVIGVGATDINDNLANFSNFGPQLDVVAPGVNVYADNAPSNHLPNDSYAAVSGTSFSTPYVAGLAALLKTTAPSANPDQIYNFITQQADKVPGMQGADRTDRYGYGRINAYRTLKASILAHPDGTLITQPAGTVSLVENSSLRYVPNPAVFFSNYGEIDSRVKPALFGDLQLGSGSNVDYAEGTLLKGDGPAIYAVENNGGSLQKRHIISVAAYQNLGYGESSRINVPSSLLPLATGADISEGLRHPYGTLIRAPESLAVYLLENGQKRYVPSPAILRSLHKGNFRVYPGVAADMQLPDGANIDYAEGTPLRGDNSPSVYVVDINGGVTTKRYITSPAIFQTLGYTATDVIDVPASQLPSANGTDIN